jgi:RNA polymerase sigma-70 factor (ECF subfamily)
VTVTPRKPTDERKLAALAGSGDAVSQQHLVALLRPRVFRISLAILGHAEDAEDATQTILLAVLQSVASFRGGSLWAWADRIAVRTAVRHARQRRVRATHFDGEADPEALGSDAGGVAPRHGLPRPILDYLAELPEARRTVLVLRHVLEYSVEEIASITESSPNTVKDRLLQARRQLRQGIRRDLAIVPTRKRGLQ